MEIHKNSYRQIIKTTSLFGGVQLVQILTTLVRGKLVALLLGTAGMGVNMLLNSVITMIVQFSSFGLNFSAVRNISQATEQDDFSKQQRVITIFRRWILFCSLFGSVLICLCAYWLSKLTFGNPYYTLSFAGLSAAVALTIMNSGNITVLQGTRRLKQMAQASVLGSLISVVVCIPFYYFLKQAGIVPALVVSAFATFISSRYYLSKQISHSESISIKETIEEGSEMAKLGIAMMAATLIGSTVTYLLNAFVSNFGSVSDVGLFGAGTSITNQYIGLVFTAMAVDYFPRLSSASHDKKKLNEMVNQQAEIVLLIVCPLLIGMILLSPILIRCLLSNQFLSIHKFVCWTAFGLLFKAAAFSSGYISFAKGDKKVFFLFEGVINSSITLISGLIGYKIGGIDGIAVASLFSNALYLLNVNIVTYHRYHYRINRSLVVMFLLSTLLLSCTLFLVLTFPGIYAYTLGVLILLFSILYSFNELDKRILIKSLILSKLNHKNRS